MSIKEALIGVFSDDPINWLKWGIVFAILIGGYIIAIPLYGKVSSRLSWERKRDIARSRDHVIKAALVKSIQKAKWENMIGALPTITNYRVKSENITPTSKNQPDHLFICICTIWIIPASCFRWRNITMRTTKQSCFCLSFFFRGFWRWLRCSF